ncbi:MAG: hypothetical protein PS018_23715 [bacterium]|nr:hypothetical protein [bacterium]
MSEFPAQPNQLAAFLRLAREKSWCHRWGCTTCGSEKFYGGLQDLADQMGGGLSGRTEMVRSLATAPFVANEALIESVLVWLAQDISADDLRRALEQTEAGALFSAMNRAREAAQARRHAHSLRNDPAFVEAERARKKAERSAAHQERLAAKALRDAARKGTS